MITFQNKPWQHMVTRNFSFFHACLEVVASSVDMKLFGVPSKDELLITKDGRITFLFLNTEKLPKFYAAIEEICTSKSKLSSLNKAYVKYCKELLVTSKKLEKHITLKNYRDFCLSYRHLTAGLTLTTLTGRRASELLNTKLELLFPHYRKEQLEILASELTYPNGHTPLLDSQLSLLTIGKELQKQNLTSEEIAKSNLALKYFKAHMKKYSPIPVNFNEEPWSEDDVTKQLTELMVSNCAQEKDLLEKNHVQRIKLSNEKLNKISNKELNILVEAIRKITLINEYRKYIFCNASLAYRPLFAATAKKCNSNDWHICWKLTPLEIEHVYFRNKKIKQRTLDSRGKTAVMYNESIRTYSLLPPKTADDFLNNITQTTAPGKNNPLNEVNGIVANPGKVSGIAKIIFGSHDFNKFKTGDIIIAPMTSVDFVPLMKRASAFVTNEGGITSHASIVSRELNKPCIIGTKNATEIFKDGDLIEVDAHKGIIKKIPSELSQLMGLGPKRS